MANSVIEIINNYPETVTKTVDLTFQYLSQTGQRFRRGYPDPILSKYIVMQRYISPRLALQKLGETVPTFASIVGVDGEYPLKREAIAFSQDLIGSIKIARARLLTEEDFDLLYDAELHLKANSRAVYEAIAKEFLQIPAYLTRGVTLVTAFLLLQLYSSGTSTYVDPDTGLGFELSYVADIPSTNIPLALTGTNLWSDAVNSKPLENLRDHLAAYFLNAATMPEDIEMPATVADYMLSANDTKLKIIRMNGNFGAITPGDLATFNRPTIEDVRNWLTREIGYSQMGATIPNFIVTSATYKSGKDVLGNDIYSPYMPADKYVFMVSGNIEGAYVPTATNNYASSLAIATEVLSQAPRREKVSVDTKFLAICPDPRLLAWRKVI